MTRITLLERLKTIIELIKSQSFFVTLFFILLLTIIVLVVNIKVKSRAPKYAIAIAYSGLAILMLARYGQYMLSLNDSIVDKFFRAMYFPNIVVYLSMLVLTVLFLIYNIINEKCITFTKICSFLCFFVIWFLFVLTVDSVKKEGLSFYEISEIYSNSTIMILMQASMCVFGLWCGLLISDVIIRKLSDKMDNKNSLLTSNGQTLDVNNQSLLSGLLGRIKKTKNEEIEDYSNEEFYNNYTNNNNITNTYNDINNQNDINFTNKL